MNPHAHQRDFISSTTPGEITCSGRWFPYGGMPNQGAMPALLSPATRSVPSSSISPSPVNMRYAMPVRWCYVRLVAFHFREGRKTTLLVGFTCTARSVWTPIGRRSLASGARRVCSGSGFPVAGMRNGAAACGLGRLRGYDADMPGLKPSLYGSYLYAIIHRSSHIKL